MDSERREPRNNDRNECEDSGDPRARASGAAARRDGSGSAYGTITSSATAMRRALSRGRREPSRRHRRRTCGRGRSPSARNHARIATVTDRSSIASMMARRPISACMSAVERTMLAIDSGALAGLVARRVRDDRSIAIVASADGSRIPKAVMPKRCAGSRRSKNRGAAATNHGCPFRCMTIQSCRSRESRARPRHRRSRCCPKAFPTPRPGSVASAPTAHR